MKKTSFCPRPVAAWLSALVLLTAAAGAHAQTTPEGLWQTYDKDTNQPKSLVRISSEGGIYRGVIEKLLDPAVANPVCDECTDDRQGKPVIGMAIIRGVRQSAEEPGLWDGGDILEPKTGAVYQVQLRLADGGKTLQVHGYVGSPMFGRTRTWTRIENQK